MDRINRLSVIYFSATGKTKKILEYVASAIEAEHSEKYDITQKLPQNIQLNNTDLAILGIPVYSGRVPAIAVNYLKQFSGNSTPAIIVCTYGNREYDDALLELKDIVESQGFVVIAAGAFIAEHCIFPVVAKNRPDNADRIKAIDFGTKAAEWLLTNGIPTTIRKIDIKGNYPYRVPRNIPLKPKGNRKCTACGACSKACPTMAIDKEHPRKTNKERCISCARCITVCPHDARHFSGLIYKIVRRKFEKAYTVQRKEPEIFFAQP